MTSVFVRPLAVTNGNQLASLVEGHLSALEPGLTLLERRFPAGEVLVDFLALDARGRLVLCVLGSGSTSVMLVQAIDACGWCCENGALLERLFPGAKLHSGPPRLFLLAPRFSDSVRRTARSLGPLSPVLVECRGVEVNGVRAVCFEAVEGMLLPEVPGSPAGTPTDGRTAPGESADDAARERVSELVRHLEHLSFREAFR